MRESIKKLIKHVLVPFVVVAALVIAIYVSRQRDFPQGTYRYPTTVCASSSKLDASDIIFIYSVPMMGGDGQLILKKRANGNYCGRWADDLVVTFATPPRIILFPKDGIQLDEITLLLIGRTGTINPEPLKGTNGVFSFFLRPAEVSEDNSPTFVTYPAPPNMRFFPGDTGE